MKVGLQTYTVRTEFARDPMGTLEKVSAAGYKYIEMANHRADLDPGTGHGTDVKDLRAKADEVGITIIGAHFMPSNLTGMFDWFYNDAARVAKVIDYYAAAGARFLSLPTDYFPDMDTLLRHCEIYNTLGKQCRAGGLKLLYHNHYHDFQTFGDRQFLDLITENTDPDLLGIELDAYWTFRGGVDPVEKIHKYGPRIAVIHEKDYPLSQVRDLNIWDTVDRNAVFDAKLFHDNIRPNQFIEVGDGIIKIQDVIDAGNEEGIEFILVEQDNTTLGEIASITRSMANFRRMRGLELPPA